MRADDPFLVTKQRSYTCVLFAPFHWRLPKRKEGGCVVMKNDASPSWILMDNLAPG